VTVVVYFNHKVHKDLTKDTKVKPLLLFLCDLCVIT